MSALYWVEHAIVHRVVIFIIVLVIIVSSKLVCLTSLDFTLEVEFLETFNREVTDVLGNLWPQEEFQPAHLEVNPLCMQVRVYRHLK